MSNLDSYVAATQSLSSAITTLQGAGVDERIPRQIQDCIDVIQSDLVEPLPASPPILSALSPSSGPAGVDITVDITGGGFDSSPSVNIGTAWGLVPSSSTPTDLTVLFSGTAHIALPGPLEVSVTNFSGLDSNSLSFMVT